MNKTIKKCIYIFGVIVIFLTAAQLGLNKYNDKFSLKRITAAHNFFDLINTQEISNIDDIDVNQALSQNYSYLAKGAQVFAFISEDCKYVIKFIKFHNKKLPFYYYLPISKNLNAIADTHRKNNLAELVEGITIADNQLKNETALIFSHLNKTSHIQRTINIKDKLGKTYQINLDDHSYFVQKHVTLLYDQIDNYMANNMPEKAKLLICKLTDMIFDNLKKGIFTDDISVYKNIGCLNESPIFIDIGKFSTSKNTMTKNELKYHMHSQLNSFSKWLKEKHPILDETQENKLAQLNWELIKDNNESKI